MQFQQDLSNLAEYEQMLLKQINDAREKYYEQVSRTRASDRDIVRAEIKVRAILARLTLETADPELALYELHRTVQESEPAAVVFSLQERPCEV